MSDHRPNINPDGSHAASGWPCIELVIDQNEGRGVDVIDHLNEALRTLERKGLLTDWTWKVPLIEAMVEEES